MTAVRHGLALIMLLAVCLTSGVASAQEVDRRPFIMRLFGIGEEPPAGPPQGAKIINVPQALKARPAVPQVIIAPKDEDARVVLVIGDRLASDLARGLDVAFADAPDVRLETDVVDPSGLRDQSATNWRERLEARLAKEPRPAAVVVMFGLDDAGPITTEDREVAFPSADWEIVYKARADGIINLARNRNLPLLWVGLVPVADAAQTNSLIYLDSIIRAEATGGDVSYVDVWDSFSLAGAFTVSGPDISGQVRQLRLKDGTGFTRSGARKLAFYVEQSLRPLLDRPNRTKDLLGSATGEGLVMLLNDPQAATDDHLVTATDLSLPKPGSPIHSLVVEGHPVAPVPGRVDDLASD
ncbi:SGNH/GDSL hydrolase family protein [Oryzibacter oryziterrae]|uniref:SGNH/GDSL hydrolase family protein n=1 Tax=Oryzibacter oryziterrae TaxID=2766474 RepID=UPI001F42FAA1|nr:hypothetical protein [Oryzibacter oryziterrae]